MDNPEYSKPVIPGSANPKTNTHRSIGSPISLKKENDEVVVLGDIQSIPNTPFVDNNDSDSDDCLMLDGDPDDNLVQVSANGDGLEEELCIVGEKGQLACRDYPHPRHLCARFPFSTTSHVKCCDMCHCYVCDSPAPCIYWGNGVSVGDHCHSSDKEDIWVRKRKCCNEMKTAQHPPETLCSINLHESIPIQKILELLHCGNSLFYTPEQMEIARKLYRPFGQSRNIGSILSYTPEQMKLAQKLSKAIHLVGLDVPDIQNSPLRPFTGSHDLLYTHRSNPRRACSSKHKDNLWKPNVTSHRKN